MLIVLPPQRGNNFKVKIPFVKNEVQVHFFCIQVINNWNSQLVLPMSFQ